LEPNTDIDPENAAQPDGTATRKSTSRQEIKREVVELVKMVVLFLVLFFFLKSFVVEGYEVQGLSMFPTLNDGERILVLKLPHKLSKIPPFRGLTPLDEEDIMVFDSLDSSGKRYIKRVIAMGPKRSGGKTVQARQRELDEPRGYNVNVKFDKGSVYVNNKKIEQDYLESVEKHSSDVDEVELLSGEYYVLGDYRSASKDSRMFGPVDNDQVIGKAWLRFWPLKKFGLL
jgi:signal peptidase I